VRAYIYIPLSAAELVELAAVGEDDERDLGVAEHGELVRLLEQPVAALGEGDLAVDLVLDPLQLNPPPPHGSQPFQLAPAAATLSSTHTHTHTHRERERLPHTPHRSCSIDRPAAPMERSKSEGEKKEVSAGKEDGVVGGETIGLKGRDERGGE